jgi:hypothetical protein
MSRHLLALAPVFSFLLAAASLAGRWTSFTLYLKHGAVASDRGRFGLYSRSIFDRMAVFDANWLEIAVAFGFLTLALALLWALSRRLETVILAGAHQCPRCGYDLTANTSGTCPECGRAVESR